MRTLCLAIILTLIPVWSGTALADNTKTIQKKGAVGCLTEDFLDEFITALSNNDRRHAGELLESALCFGITGRPYSIVDLGFMTTEIRVYTENGSVRLFVQTQFVR